MASPATPIPREALRVVPASAERWPDVVTLLGGDGDRGCWCQSWRGPTAGSAAFGHAPPSGNRAALEAQVHEGTFAPGVVAYVDGSPVGWCGLGPRRAMSRLMRSRTIPLVDDVAVWSIGCFVVRVGFRRRGVARALLEGAVAYARSMGAPAVEAYPIDPGGSRISTSFAFVGFTTTFEAAGFRRIVETGARSAGLPRWLMRLDLA
ncbi:MAG: GNAT family N-acetyltransferase [Chloroflexi bacterium]|nr:GNAT family N-acetyltransferase [Chloroflexota bacterium]